MIFLKTRVDPKLGTATSLAGHFGALWSPWGTTGEVADFADGPMKDHLGGAAHYEAQYPAHQVCREAARQEKGMEPRRGGRCRRCW